MNLSRNPVSSLPCSSPRRGILTLLLLFVCGCGSTLRMGGMEGLPTFRGNRAFRVSSSDESGGNTDGRVGIRPGETVELADLEGPATINHFWCTYASPEEFSGRKIALKIYWDDEEEPSVLCPINDFFCVGHGLEAPVSSLPITVSANGRGRNSWFRMPFKKRARFEITNEGLDLLDSFYFQIDYEKERRPSGKVGYFHAFYRQDYPVSQGRNYTMCDLSGKGHYVGCNLSVETLDEGWWGEGDDLCFVDGEEYPSIHGTGIEDYFGDAWGLDESNYSFHGTTIHDEKNHSVGRRYTSYRFHVLDPIPFDRSFRLEFEHYGEGKDNRGELSFYTERRDNWSGVAYWYQSEPHKPTGPLPAVWNRLPGEANTDRAVYEFVRDAQQARQDDTLDELRTRRVDLEATTLAPRQVVHLDFAMAGAEVRTGHLTRAGDLVLPYCYPFLNRSLELLGSELSGVLDPEYRTSRPLLVSTLDGSDAVTVKDERRCVASDQEKGKRYIYFSLPSDSPLRKKGINAKIEITCYSEGRPGDLLAVQYDSLEPTGLPGIYREVGAIEKPTDPGWYVVGIECREAWFAGRQNGSADFRIDCLRDGDEFIADVTLSEVVKTD